MREDYDYEFDYEQPPRPKRRKKRDDRPYDRPRNGVYDRPYHRLDHRPDHRLDNRLDHRLDNRPENHPRNRLGKLLVGLQALLTVVLLALVLWVDMLPVRFLAAISAVLVILWLFTVLSQSFRGGRGAGKVYAVLMICVLSLGISYVWKTHRTLLDLTAGEVFGIASEVDVAEEPFTVYISGTDSYGEVSLDDGRSDVNILMTVNPKTRQIVLTTTPRDYYVELPLGEGCWDKLTHAGIYGIDCSMSTLEALYDLEIDYYARVNFSGFERIVDALGGVEVYSDYAFTAGEYDFVQGNNSVDGEAALSFVRERYSFEEGDVQRGKNQMAMIRAIMDKATSPSLLTGYLGLMDSLSDCVITNMPRGSLSDLMKLQLSEGGSWHIVTNSVTGEGAEAYTYSGGDQMLSVMLQDEASIENAKDLIDRCKNGEILPD